MPSAVVWMFRLPAEAQHSAHDFLLPLVVTVGRDETLVDLDLVKAIAGKLGEAGIAGAEIVKGDLDACTVKLLLQDCGGARRVLDQRILGDFDLEAVGGQAGCGERFEDARRQQPILHLDRRYIERQRQVVVPGQGVTTGLCQQILKKGGDQPGLLRNRDEDQRRDICAVVIRPAGEGFEAARIAGLQVDQWLVKRKTDFFWIAMRSFASSDARSATLSRMEAWNAR